MGLDVIAAQVTVAVEEVAMRSKLHQALALLATVDAFKVFAAIVFRMINEQVVPVLIPLGIVGATTGHSQLSSMALGDMYREPGKVGKGRQVGALLAAGIEKLPDEFILRIA